MHNFLRVRIKPDLRFISYRLCGIGIFSLYLQALNTQDSYELAVLEKRH
jgi:hypothetical protein